ncbi:MAG: HAD-IIIA family hydrolase [Chitinophagia bacterium]|nr:HAD-IIIA family hydrolase [Chitinophagia bacterium]
MEAITHKPEPDKTWTLFLDRDGVINVELLGSYVTRWEDFEFHDGVLEAMRQLSDIFGNIVVVTNQRGVGKGVMSIDDLKHIHLNMKQQVRDSGGRIDKVYSATAVADTDHNRKPNTGMGVQAQQDYPEIDFRRSIMVGNSMSDMEFGKRLHMHTVFLTTKHEPYPMPHDFIDEQYPSLLAWAASLIPTEMMR